MGTEDKDVNRPSIDMVGRKKARRFILAEHVSAARAVQRAGSAIDSAVEKMVTRLEVAGSRIFYAGAGTSGRQAVADGAELPPTFGWSEDRVVYCMAGFPASLWQSIEGAEDNVDAAQKLVSLYAVNEHDVLIAVAASGTTPFTGECLREAKKRGALTIGIANNNSSPILTESECPIFLDTGSEPIAGSTRMKAGTAQRIVLNTLSTLVMADLGYVYHGEMVNVHAKCTKIDTRRVKMVMRLTDCSEERARDSLSQADGDVRIAVLLTKGWDLLGAQCLLEITDEKLGPALVFHELEQKTK